MLCGSLLQQRLSSHAHASCSRRSIAVPVVTRSWVVRQHARSSRPRPRPTFLRAKAAELDDVGEEEDEDLEEEEVEEVEEGEEEEVEEEEEGEEDEMEFYDPEEEQTPFDTITYLNNRTPDFDDPDWADHVTDWAEFWFNPEWEEDILELEDEHDVSTAVTSSIRLERAEQLLGALADLDKKQDVIHFLGSVERTTHTITDPEHFDLPNVRDDPNPAWSAFDFRAWMEKRRKREMLDQEWRRRQALVGRFNGLDMENDVRLREPISVTWPEEEIMKLITGDGAYVHPDKVQVVIQNPLAVIDYSGQYGVKHIPDTEEAIAEMGHFADEHVLAKFQKGVELGEGDFVDPTVAFGDPVTGTMYMDAPINNWGQLQRARDADEVAELMELMEGDGEEGEGLTDEELEAEEDEAQEFVLPPEWYEDEEGEEGEEEEMLEEQEGEEQ